MPNYRIAVVGSREFNDYDELKYQLSDFIVRLYEQAEVDAPEEQVEITIVSGGARGADSLAKRYAAEFSCNYLEFLPDWSTHGKSAGFIRNRDIVNAATHLVAFWDGLSRGTKHSIDLANERSIPVEVYTPEVPANLPTSSCAGV